MYGVDDPNPLVSGRGLEILRRAGKVVRKTQALEGELHDLVEIFLHSMKNTSAFVALKVATTLDGKIAFTNGDSQWITSEASRLRAHELRGEYDAVLIGQRTLQVDRPRLNSRHPKFVNKKNSVIVLDPLGTCLELLKDHPLSEVGRRPEQIVVVVNKPVASDFGFQIIHCPTVQDGVFDLPVLLKELYSRGLTSVFVEGGAHTLSQFVAQYAAQRLYQFVNPSLMGHHETITWTQHLKVDSINSRPFLTKVRWEWIEDDAMVTGLLPGRERISLV
jgi:diaminohydroxyphosphoribosylaminopyrimidine deaminase/5-amino-6-(5-phosphoribosylamino)uracil reductase